ncbi:hypothetical protein [Peribacillus simplex]|uniref:hypothetical protein n=1 Tax=Peribacillus TaxID=2675229 RepID=UPI0036DA59C5
MKKHQIDLTNLDLTKPDTWWANTKEVEQTQEISNIKAWLQSNGYTGKDIRIIAVPLPHPSSTNKWRQGE